MRRIICSSAIELDAIDVQFELASELRRNTEPDRRDVMGNQRRRLGNGSTGGPDLAKPVERHLDDGSAVFPTTSGAVLESRPNAALNA
jgi:hypothetical protein